jgi:predicted short-subunit dehydrogenase-like oxidoreductase (DUF2520 family)
MIKIGFIGAGRLGSSLALLLSKKSYQITAVYSRSHSSSLKMSESIKGCHICSSGQDLAEKAELVFITTPDDVITSISDSIKWQPGQMAVHCSGVDSLDLLASAHKDGALTGVFHPLQTFTNSEQALENIKGSTFTIEAPEPLLGKLKKIAYDLGGRWIEIKSEDKVIYHTAAVFACNYLVTLMKVSTDLWQTFGISPRQSIQALLPLVKGTINNIETVGLPDCLTGPIARGDTGTIIKHINALSKKAPHLISTYKELALKTIPIALDKGGINKSQALNLKAILTKEPKQGDL